MSETQKTFIDGDNYLRCSAPYATADEANAALEAFWNDVYELRNKHRISDVLVVFRVQVLGEDGRAHEVIGKLMAGSDMFAEPLAAWALGRASAERQTFIGNLISSTAGASGGVTLPSLKRKK